MGHKAEQSQLDANLAFLRDEKGCDIDTLEGLQRTLAWVATTIPENLMYGEPTGDSFDIYMGSIRRGMLMDDIIIAAHYVGAGLLCPSDHLLIVVGRYPVIRIDESDPVSLRLPYPDVLGSALVKIDLTVDRTELIGISLLIS